MIMIHDLWTIKKNKPPKKLIPMAEKSLQEAINADILLFFFFHMHIFSHTLSI